MARKTISWGELQKELDRHPEVSYTDPKPNMSSGWTVSIENGGHARPGTGFNVGGGEAEIISQAHGEHADARSFAKFSIEGVYDAFKEVGVNPTSEFIKANPPEGGPKLGEHRETERERREREERERLERERERERREHGKQ